MKLVRGFVRFLLLLAIILGFIVGGVYSYNVQPYKGYLDKIIRNFQGEQFAGIIGNYRLGLVELNGSYFADSYGRAIVLINNSDAADPTYTELMEFLQQDNTDSFPNQPELSNLPQPTFSGSIENSVDLKEIQKAIDNLLPYPGVPRLTADFAERLHNNSEMAGIRCGFALVQLEGLSGLYTLDVYNTSDKGLVYIDDIGSLANSGMVNSDKVVELQVGQPYIPTSLFPGDGLYSWTSQGVVKTVNTIWENDW